MTTVVEPSLSGAFSRRGAMVLGAALVPGIASVLNATPASAAATASTPVSVFDTGAVGDGVTDDTAAVRAAVALAVAESRPLVFPPGTFLVDAPILVKDAPDFVIEIQGRLKRKAGSNGASLLQFYNCTNLLATTLRTDGNAVNNGKVQADGVRYPVDEVKHDVRLDACVNAWIGLIDSVNPAGDALYLAGGAAPCSDVKVEHLSARADTRSGRSAVSIIAGRNLMFGTVRSTGLGCNKGFPMPGGFQIEPNPGDSVSNVVVGDLLVDTAGATGLGIYSPHGKYISNVTINSCRLTKLAGVHPNACDINIRGAVNVTVGELQHESDPSNTNAALSIDSSDHIDLTVKIPRLGSRPVNLGPGGAVTRLTLRGSLAGGKSHLIQVFNLNDSTIDMTLRDAAIGCMYVVKSATGTSTRVRWSGDWRKGTGSICISGSGQLSEWLLENVDMAGWGRDSRIKPGPGAHYLGSIRKSRVNGLTDATSTPTYDYWAKGDYVENTTPTELGVAGQKYVVRGWLATQSGYHTAAAWVQCRTLTGR